MKGRSFPFRRSASSTLHICAEVICADTQLRSSTDDFAGYLKGNYFPDASNGTIDTLMSHYPEDPATGSPFDTGDDFEITTVYKRMAAFQGDLIFQAPRRFFLSERSAKQPAWSFCELLR